LFSDLELHQSVPVRLRPRIGEWGPRHVPTTAGKKTVRVIVPLLGLAVATAIFFLGHWVFQVIAQAVGL
jgi:hypothetical protein